MRTLVRRVGGLACLAALLAACDTANTTGASNITDTDARLIGDLHTDDEGSTLTWWFDFGTTASLGSTTPEQTIAEAATNTRVTAEIAGLDEDTTYHYRACVRNVRGGGLCGEVRTFTTTTGRDSIHGTGIVVDEPPDVVSATVEASANADGSDVSGSVVSLPGSQVDWAPDSGSVLCLRVEAGRAVVGFAVLVPSPAAMILYVDDNGTTGDRYALREVGDVGPHCPAYSSTYVDTYGQTVTTGDFVLHDHPLG